MSKKKTSALFAAFMVVLIGVLFIYGFSNMKNPETDFNGLGTRIDISPDDSRMLFSYFKNGTASVYTANLDGTDVKRLTHPSDVSHLSPKFSPDGNKILFLSYREENEKPRQELYVMNADGSHIRRLSEPDSLITDAVFSVDGKTIYFIKAGVFKHYSPIASAHPHDFDIYSIHVDGSHKKQLTFVKQYEMSSLSVSKDGSKLFFEAFGELDGPDSPEESFRQNQRIYALDLHKSKDISRVTVPQEKFKSYGISDAVVSPNGEKFAFSAVANKGENGLFEYELFTIDQETKNVKQLTHLHRNTGSPVFFHKQNKMLFVEHTNWPAKPPENKIWMINTDGSGLQEIVLNLNRED